MKKKFLNDRCIEVSSFSFAESDESVETGRHTEWQEKCLEKYIAHSTHDLIRKVRVSIFLLLWRLLLFCRLFQLDWWKCWLFNLHA